MLSGQTSQRASRLSGFAARLASRLGLSDALPEQEQPAGLDSTRDEFMLLHLIDQADRPASPAPVPPDTGFRLRSRRH